MQKRAYGQQLAEALHVGRARTFVTKPILQRSGIAVTEVRRDHPQNGYTSPVPLEDAFLVTLNIRDWPKRILWIDGKPVSALPLKAGSSNIFDLRRKYIGYGASSFHMMSFYLPRAVLNSIGELEGTRPIDGFAHDPRRGIDDTVIRELGLSLFPAFQRPGETNTLFVDHITTAIAAHVLHAYGVPGKKRGKFGRGLAKWQEERVKAILSADLQGNVSIVQLAGECGMSPSGFSTAFKNVTGLPPHRWLLERRVEKAMTLMRQRTCSLDHVARQCGFHDEHHLSRVFGNIAGATPQDWRRTILS
ncbi:AraC family transcriptional regulator [Bradyrhizobium sp. UFLA05-109]